MNRFEKTQKFRITISDIPFHATASDIRAGAGYTTRQNAAIQQCLDALEFQRSGTGIADQCTCGIAGIWEGYNVKIDIA